MSLFDLTGKVAIITGSSRGIGRAIAEAMADQGAKVVISSRKAEACQEVADAINAKHGEGRAIVVPANISSKEELQHLVDETRAQLGRIDILVCNAASNPYYGPMARDQRRPVPQDPRQQRHRQPLADPDGRARDDRAQGRLDHHRQLDRRPQGLAGDRRLQHLQGGRLPARPQPRRRVRAAPGPGQLHRAGPDPDRFRQGAVGKSADAEDGHRRTRRCSGSASPRRSPAPPSSSPRRASTFMTGQAIVVDGGSDDGSGAVRVRVPAKAGTQSDAALDPGFRRDDGGAMTRLEARSRSSPARRRGSARRARLCSRARAPR